MGDARAELRAGFQHAPRDEDGHHDRVVENHPQAVEEPIARGALHEEIVLRLRMEEEHGAHGLGRFEEREELGAVPLLTVHLRVELGALEAEHGHRPLQLVDGRLDVLHGQRREAGEAPGLRPHDTGDLVVDLTREQPALLHLQVVAEEGRMNGQHLDVDALRIHVLQALVRGEADLG